MPIESEPMVKATGFREYDARWLFGKEINLMGMQALGMGLGALIAELGRRSRRSSPATISAAIRPRSNIALISGLMAAGCKVHDIGLAVTPMAYFAQFDLDVPCVRDGHRLAQRQWLDRRRRWAPTVRSPSAPTR